MMILVSVPAGVMPCQIEIPQHQLDKRGRPMLDDKKQPVPFGERSCEGSLHLRPNSTKTITEAELAYVNERHPELRLHVVQVLKPESAPAPKPPKASKGKGESAPEQA